MKKVLLFILFICISSCYSQNWLWARSTIGDHYDVGSSVSADAGGNVFVTGFFESSFITFGNITLTNVGNADFFIAKYDANGNVLWAKSAGGTAGEGGCSVSADIGGNVLVVGSFYSPNITFGSVTLTNSGVKNLFVVKYDSSGNVLWAKSAGGTAQDEASSVSADVMGNMFVTGYFTSPTINFGSIALTNTGGSDVFIVKYDINGNVLWAKSATGAGGDNSLSVNADVSGNVLITGIFGSHTFTLDSDTLVNAGSYNVFIAKYDANGNLLWAKSASGTNGGEGNSVNADARGNVFVTGYFYSNITFDSITLVNYYAGRQDFFILKYDSMGNLLWAKSAGGTNDDEGWSVSTDTGANVFVTGRFDSPSIIFGSITLIPPMGSSNPMFLVKYDANGNVLCASALASGGGNNNAVSVDPFGNAYMGGDFHVNPFIVGTDTLYLTGQQNVFVAKYRCSGNGSTLINGLKNEEGIAIFPNPSLGILTVTLLNSQDAKVYVHDVLGNCYWSKICRGSVSTIIDLTGLSRGIYFLEIMSDGERVVKKIVLE